MARFVKRGKVWQYEISYKDKDGMFKKLRKSGFSKKTEAIAAAGEIEADLFKGFNATYKDLPLSEYFEKWIKTYKKDKVSTNTYKKYLYTLNIVKSYFANVSVKSLTRSNYQQLLNEYAKTHSTSSTKQINVHIHASMENLLDEHVLAIDFTKGAITIGSVAAKQEKDKFLNYNDFSRLIELVKSKLTPIYASPFMIYVASMTGMRFSELAGLTWDNVNLKEQYINITRTWNFNLNKFDKTKNTQSIRKIAIDDETTKTMNEFKEKQKELFKKYEVKLKHDFVFYNLKDGLVSNNAVNHQIRDLCNKLDIDTHLTCHGLRHSHASLLIYKGVNILYVSRRLGHSNFNVTMEVYAHAIKELQEQESENIKKILKEIA